MLGGKMDQWGSHLPLLVAAVGHCGGGGRWLELGCGHYSTPVLHALALSTESVVVSTDYDARWVEKFAWMRDVRHDIRHASDVCAFVGQPWDVVLVDCTPAQKRIEFIAALRPTTRLFVAHDTEPGRPVYRYAELLPSFPNRFDYTVQPAWTSVLSDDVDLGWFERLFPVEQATSET